MRLMRLLTLLVRAWRAVAHTSSLTHSSVLFLARILRICEGAAERQVKSGDVQGAIALLLGAASEYGYAHGEAERLRARAASLGAESSDPPCPGAVRWLAEAQATELEVRRKLR